MDAAALAMLHSGSRLVGNFTCKRFIDLAEQDAMGNQASMPEQGLAHFEKGSRCFSGDVRAAGWAQRLAAIDRELMMRHVIEAAKRVILKNFQSHIKAVNCHHNCVSRKNHFAEDLLVTRKGAVSAKAGQLGVIPGSVGARS